MIPIKEAPSSHDFNSFFQPFAGNKKGHHRLQGLDSGTDKGFLDRGTKCRRNGISNLRLLEMTVRFKQVRHCKQSIASNAAISRKSSHCGHKPSILGKILQPVKHPE